MSEKQLIKTQINNHRNERDIIDIGVIDEDYVLEIYKNKKDKICVVSYSKKHYFRTVLSNSQVEYLANTLNNLLDKNKKDVR